MRSVDEKTRIIVFIGFKEDFIQKHKDATEEEIQLAFEQFKKDGLFETKVMTIRLFIVFGMVLHYVIPGVVLALFGIYFGWNDYIAL